MNEVDEQAGQPDVVRSPAEHYIEADRLLKQVETPLPWNDTLPWITNKIARAHVHALLAQHMPPPPTPDAETVAGQNAAGQVIDELREAITEIRQLAETNQPVEEILAVLEDHRL